MAVETYTRVNWKDKQDSTDTPITAANLNKMDEGIANNNTALIELEKTVDEMSMDSVEFATAGASEGAIKFGVDSDGNYGYFKVGADTLIPFKNPTDATLTNAGALTVTGAEGTELTKTFENSYDAGVTAADARVNTSSANYQGGYSAGVTAADSRVNTSSASYTSGYSAGVSAGAAVVVGTYRIQFGTHVGVSYYGGTGTGYIDLTVYSNGTASASLVSNGSCSCSGTEGSAGANVSYASYYGRV